MDAARPRMSGACARRLRVLLVDTSPRHRPGSMRRYGDMVMAALRAAGCAEWDLRRLELGPPPRVSSAIPARLEPWARRVWGRLGAMAVGRARADVVHVLDASSGLSFGLRLGVPVVATIHDLIPLLQLRGRLDGGPRPSLAARRVIRRTALDLVRARRLVADSRRTAEDAIELAQVEASRVVTLPLAVPPAFDDGTCDRPASEGRFILHVGNGGFYKNGPGTLRIFGQVRRQTPVRLVVVGSCLGSGLDRLAARLGCQGDIEMRPRVTDAELAALYRRASLLLMPSLYEGFGWPALEAMASGCPVVCSTAGSLPEVVGEVALTAPAADERRLAEHVLAILGDGDLARRLGARGRERAKGFRLEDMGRRLADVYVATADALSEVAP
jgi:glycosyltransferase involved in cell wall biosynthesis